ASGERGGEFPGGHHDREVPRDDLAGDADRLTERQVPARADRLVRLAEDLVRRAGVILEADRDALHLCCRVADRLPAVLRLQFGELLCALVDERGGLEQDLAPPPTGPLPPGAFVEGCSRGADSALGVLYPGVGHSRQRLASGGVQRLVGLAINRGRALAADQ